MQKIIASLRINSIATDHLGSVRTISDANGSIVKAYSYDAWGNRSSLTDNNPAIDIPIGFAGGLYDKDTNLIRFGYRDYDPEVGRWTARDPIGFAGGDTNIYTYALNSPVGVVDPIGLCGPLTGICVQAARFLVAQAPGALIAGSATGGVELAKTGDVKAAAQKAAVATATGLIPGGSGIAATATKTYLGSNVASVVVDGKSINSVDVQVDAAIATTAGLLTQPITGLVPLLQPTLGQLIVAEAVAQSFGELVGGTIDRWDSPYDDGYSCRTP